MVDPWGTKKLEIKKEYTHQIVGFYDIKTLNQNYRQIIKSFAYFFVYN